MSSPSRPHFADAPADAIVLQFDVPRECAGWRIDRFLQRKIPRLSRTRAQSIVRACARRDDGRRRKPSERVQPGERVYLVRERFVEPDAPRDFAVLYEDDAIYVIDKPSGLPVHPSATYHRNTVTWILRERFGDGRPRIVHRLDRETSGVLVCAKSLEAERALKRAFEARRVDKEYLAVVRGRPEPTRGVIELALAPFEGHGNGPLHVMMEVRHDGSGSPAKTEYQVLHTDDGRSLVSLHPVSGRQHQLRVHLAAIEHSIVGDKLYGPEGPDPFLEYIATGTTPELIERLGHERQALHAHRIAFEHPISGEPFTIAAPFPKDLEAVWGVPIEHLARHS